MRDWPVAAAIATVLLICAVCYVRARVQQAEVDALVHQATQPSSPWGASSL